jgi:DNA-binding GntR family transcriptional regulator
MEALYVTPDRRRDNIEEHRAVLQAVVGGDAPRARQAMRRHLVNAERQRLTDLQHTKIPGEPGAPDR